MSAPNPASLEEMLDHVLIQLWEWGAHSAEKMTEAQWEWLQQRPQFCRLRAEREDAIALNILKDLSPEFRTAVRNYFLRQQGVTSASFFSSP